MKLIRNYTVEPGHRSRTKCHIRWRYVGSYPCTACDNFISLDTESQFVECNIPDQVWNSLEPDIQSKILEDANVIQDGEETPSQAEHSVPRRANVKRQWTLEDHKRLISVVDKVKNGRTDNEVARDDVCLLDMKMGRDLLPKSWRRRIRIARAATSNVKSMGEVLGNVQVEKKRILSEQDGGESWVTGITKGVKMKTESEKWVCDYCGYPCNLEINYEDVGGPSKPSGCPLQAGISNWKKVEDEKEDTGNGTMMCGHCKSSGVFHCFITEIGRLEREKYILMQQRDDARRDVCCITEDCGTMNQREYADYRGWDCFPEIPLHDEQPKQGADDEGVKEAKSCHNCDHWWMHKDMNPYQEEYYCREGMLNRCRESISLYVLTTGSYWQPRKNGQ